jgi:hypothetical protein
MGVLYKLCIIFVIILLPAGISAATVENLDFVDYKIKAIYDNGKIVSIPLYSRAEKLGICDYGCTLELLKTGQKIEVKPDDEIVIEDGVMKRKE